MKSVATSLAMEMQLKEPTCYTDSEVSLYWIRAVDQVWKQFVQHRVVETRNLLSSVCWHHCLSITTQLTYRLEVLNSLILPRMSCGKVALSG